jgi:hypothetical protein
MLAEQGYALTGSDPALGRIALVAVAIAAVGVFTLLQIRARSRRPAARRAAIDAVRQPALGARRRPILGARRRARAGHDWRTLPPPYAASAPDEWAPLRDHDDYGPLWRYGSPRGYGRDYGPGHRPAYGPRYLPDDAPGYRPDDGRRLHPDDDSGRGAGREPGYPAGPWPPRGTPAPYEEPRDWGS